MLRGKNAVITGANRGIGRACVEYFASQGANIWACARKEYEGFAEDMRSIAAKNNVEIWPVYFDIANKEMIKAAAQMIIKQKIPIDILVNNAGIAKYSNFQFLNMEELNEVFSVNYIGQLSFTQLLARRMGRNKEASIVFISSVAGLQSESGSLAYGGSKSAIAHAVGVLSRELSGQNIRVNAIAPGLVDTDMKKMADVQYWHDMVMRTDLKRSASPEEVAHVVAFLAGDLSSYITGQVLRVDGGLH